MAKIDELKIKYPKVTTTVSNTFFNGDVTPTKKYLEYMFKYWANRNRFDPYSSKDIVKMVNKFDMLLPYIQNKDIYSKQYEAINQLEIVVNESEKIKLEKEFIREDHVDVIFENDDFLLLRPKTFQGSNKYGANTKWCTTGRNQNYFKDYMRSSFLIYLISKKERSKNYNKVAFLTGKVHTLINPIKIWNQMDTEISNEGTLIKNGWGAFEIFEIFSKIRAYCYEESYKETIKGEINGVITKLESIDIDNFFKNIDTLNNFEGAGKEYKEKLDILLNRLKLKINV
jgi:hypothetical protein